MASDLESKIGDLLCRLQDHNGGYSPQILYLPNNILCWPEEKTQITIHKTIVRKWNEPYGRACFDEITERAFCPGGGPNWKAATKVYVRDSAWWNVVDDLIAKFINPSAPDKPIRSDYAPSIFIKDPGYGNGMMGPIVDHINRVT